VNPLQPLDWKRGHAVEFQIDMPAVDHLDVEVAHELLSGRVLPFWSLNVLQFALLLLNEELLLGDLNEVGRFR
jgi:hypothetical protein